jgi:hypothetical protein
MLRAHVVRYGYGHRLLFSSCQETCGRVRAVEVAVIDTLPPEVAFGGVLGDGWSCGHDARSGGGPVNGGQPSLGVMTAPVNTNSVTAPPSDGNIANSAVVSGAEIDPSPEDNTATTETQVSPVAMPYFAYLPLVVEPPPSGSAWQAATKK